MSRSSARLGLWAAFLAFLLLAAPLYASLIDTLPPQATNLALGANPYLSDNGWGGGWNKAAITDGLREYNTWASGLAFTGGSYMPQIAGERHAVIDFGTATTFNEIVVWHHGSYHAPANPWLEYWDGTAWQLISVTSRTYDFNGGCRAPGTNSGGSDCDVYTFSGVTGSMFRYSFDNRQNNVDGYQILHGWIYEIEAYNYNNNRIPEPSTLVLLGSGMLFVARRLKRKVA